MLTRYYRKKTKKDFQQKLVKGTKFFLKKKKKRSVNMVVNKEQYYTKYENSILP